MKTLAKTKSAGITGRVLFPLFGWPTLSRSIVVADDPHFDNEPRPDHLKIIAALLRAGADVRQVARPVGHPEIDGLLDIAQET